MNAAPTPALPTLKRTGKSAITQVFAVQLHMMHRTVGPLALDVMGGLTVKPDPYTEVYYHTEGGPSMWQRYVHIALFFSTAVTGLLLLNGHQVAVAGYPLVAYFGGAFALYSVFIMASVEPLRIVKDVRYLGGAAEAFDTLWNTGHHCVICDAPLVVATGGLRCRECGLGHTYTGELKENTA